MAMEILKKKLEDLTLASAEYPEEVKEKDYDRNVKKEVEQLVEIFETQGIEGLKIKLSENADNWRTIPVNIAVTGTSGAGKSSFINAFLGLSDEDDSAAQVGEEETTTELQFYFNAKRPNLKLWDMPGVGTCTHPRETYLEKMKFDQYDFFMILSRARFTEDDAWLAVEIQKRNKRFYFIRTNIDTDLSNNKLRTKSKHNPEEVKNTVREKIRSNLENSNVKNPKIFMINNFDTGAHDFGEIERQMIEDCDTVKKEALTLSLINMTANVLYHKRDSLKKLSTDAAMAIACETDLMVQIRLYRQHLDLLAEQFGIDMNTVMNNKGVLSVTEENLEAYLKLMVVFPLQNIFKIPWLQNVSVKSLIFRFLEGKTKHPRYEELFKFCCLAFEINIDEMYTMALSMYDLEAHEAVVSATLYGGKSE